MIAKGRVFITAESLKTMFNLPDEVEFLTVERQDAHEGQGGIEFVIASKEPIKGLTQENPSWSGLNTRRVRVPFEQEYYIPSPLVYGSTGSGKSYSPPMPSQRLGFGNDFLTRETGFGVRLK